MPVKASALACMASRFEMEPAALMNTLKNTVFKGATNEQLAALVIVANEHRLNPFTREIYAFPDKSGGIQAVIGVDGWIRIITTNPKFDGVEFIADDESCTCVMHVKERTHAVKVTEYLSECRRNTEPWRTHPKRMLRHKALIQAGRIAFGLGSLKDEDDVVVYPASVTVRPVFQQEPAAITQAEPQQDNFTSPEVSGEAVPQAEQNQTEPIQSAAGIVPDQAERPAANLLSVVQGLIKLGGHTETDALQYLREMREVDASLSSLEEVQAQAPAAIQFLHDNWKAVDTTLKGVKKKGPQKR